MRGGLYQTKDKVHPKFENRYIAHHYSGYPVQGNIVERLSKVLGTKYDPEKCYDEYIKKLPKKEEEKLTEQRKNDLKKYFSIACKELNTYIEIINRRVKDEKRTNLERDLQKFEKEYYTTEKVWKEGNGYQPVIECQFKTIQTSIEAELGLAKHSEYKGESAEKIQEEYDKTGDIPLSRLPIMYMSELKRYRDGTPIPPQVISSRHTQVSVYHSLIAGDYKEDRKENNEEGYKGEAK